MSNAQIPSRLLQELHGGITLGIIGLGTFGEQIRDAAAIQGAEILLCDPPRAMQENEALKDAFFELWGNGMGGCTLTGADMDTFLPLECLRRADIIALQVPMVPDGQFKTTALIDQDFLSKCKPQLKLFCFSNPEVIALPCRSDARIIYC